MKSTTEFLESYGEAGVVKARSPAWRLLLLAMLAGALIALGASGALVSTIWVDNPSLTRLVSGLIFPLGLILVIFTGAELFTGNCLLVIPLLQRRITLGGMIRNLALVYLGNFAGAFLVAAACIYSGLFLPFSYSGLEALTLIETAANKCTLSFGPAVVLGILCNLLVCAGVQCALCGKSSVCRGLGAYVPVALFVICGFEHCVANMFYIPAGLILAQLPEYAVAHSHLDLSALTWGSFFLKNLLPVTIGNILGGCGFGALLWLCHRGPAQPEASATDTGLEPPAAGA